MPELLGGRTCGRIRCELTLDCVDDARTTLCHCFDYGEAGETQYIQADKPSRHRYQLFHFRFFVRNSLRGHRCASGGATSMTRYIDQVPAIVHALFPGQDCGHSPSKILIGQIHPSGRLPLSWPKTLEDNFAYSNFPADKDLLLRYV